LTGGRNQYFLVATCEFPKTAALSVSWMAGTFKSFWNFMSTDENCVSASLASTKKKQNFNFELI
jgi:hypothetical protein